MAPHAPARKRRGSQHVAGSLQLARPCLQQLQMRRSGAFAACETLIAVGIVVVVLTLLSRSWTERSPFLAFFR